MYKIQKVRNSTEQVTLFINKYIVRQSDWKDIADQSTDKQTTIKTNYNYFRQNWW
jgi:hypothetical protein